ncbi:MAG TPA: type II toxin-antitoxin system HicB family antitoxin [Candidatus Binataceae bacterium]|nr:type II toxin-antitoxin system HicB family antitoxin [Candidatus Binataceae bacterium]
MASYLEYMTAAMRNAKLELSENGTWFASIPGFDGLWAVGATVESARLELWNTLDGWLDVHMKVGGSKPPEVDGLSLDASPKLVE